MLKLVRAIISRLVCRFRSRAVVELENVALRHQLQVLRRQRPGRLRLFMLDRLLWDHALPIAATLSGSDGVGQAGNGDPVAPSGLPLFLATALEIRATISRARGSRSDSADEQRQPAVGCAPDPRRAAQARHRSQPSDRRGVLGQLVVRIAADII